MAAYLDTLVALPPLLVYLVVAVLVLGESAAFVGLVLPGETALLAGGAVAALGHTSLPVLIGVAAVGAITGDAVGYWIGRWLGPAARTSRAGRWVGGARWDRAEDVMVRRGGVAVLTGRWVGVLRALVPAVAGMTGMPFRSYMLYNVIGGVVWVTGVSTAGYLAGSALGASALGYLSAGLLALTVGLVVGHLVTGWLRALARRHRPRWERAVGPGVLSAVLGTGFLLAAGTVTTGRGGWTRLDTPTLAWVAAHRSTGFTDVARWATQLGGPTVTAVAAAVVGALLWKRGQRGSAVWVLASTVVAGVLILAAKLVVARPRPPAWLSLVTETDPSFPSGHVTGAVVLYGMIAVLLLGRVLGRAGRVVVVGVAVVLVAATVVLRLYLGVHYPSDVLGSLLLGGAVLAGSVAVRRVHGRPRSRPAAVVVPTTAGVDDRATLAVV